MSYTSEELISEAKVNGTESIGERILVQDFIKANNIVSVNPTVGESVNGVPFVTFINKDNVSQCIFFSKNAGELVTKGEVIIKGFFEPFKIAPVKLGTTGEWALKLVSAKEGGNRLAVDDLF